jgi:hypothetical protein
MKSRENGRKSGFPACSLGAKVSEDWVVKTVDIELAAHHAVVETC